jgi:hypothetical protein
VPHQGIAETLGQLATHLDCRLCARGFCRIYRSRSPLVSRPLVLWEPAAHAHALAGRVVGIDENDARCGKNLDRAFAQAKDYFPGLPDAALPRFVIVSDFARIRLYDMETGQQ